MVSPMRTLVGSKIENGIYLYVYGLVSIGRSVDDALPCQSKEMEYLFSFFVRGIMMGNRVCIPPLNYRDREL